MFELLTEIEIKAPAERVWRAITDFKTFPDWNPFMLAIEGEPRKGARLKVTLRAPGGGDLTFRPVVLAAEQGRELRWRGRLLLPGERFSGVLVPWLRSTLERDTRRGFMAMNQAMKWRLERGVLPC